MAAQLTVQQALDLVVTVSSEYNEVLIKLFNIRKIKICASFKRNYNNIPA